MIGAKKCARCGCMYIAETEVCGNCLQRDGAEIYRLKGFLEQETGEFTQGELSIATGISNKNLSRFLAYEEFKGVCAPKKAVAASGKNEEIDEIIEELV